jgi:7-keto-8-aminopelargonate synthetase-like enzyme
MVGLEDRVLARLYTFGKALAASGGTRLSSGSLQSSLFTVTVDAHQANYQ